MKKFVICVDMDDTIEDLITPWIEYLNKKHGLNVNPAEVDDWAIEKFFPTLTAHDVFAPLWDPELWDNVKPKHDSPYWLKRLIDDGHKVYICTCTHYKVASFKMDKALFKYFPYLSNKDLIMMRDKQMIRCDYLVDDGIHNIIGEYKGLLMDTPHNRSFEGHPNVIRVFDWEDVYNIITKEANKK